jgi:hypothetical protein
MPKPKQRFAVGARLFPAHINKHLASGTQEPTQEPEKRAPQTEKAPTAVRPSALDKFCCYAAALLDVRAADFLCGSRRPIRTIPAQTTMKATIGNMMVREALGDIFSLWPDQDIQRNKDYH